MPCANCTCAGQASSCSAKAVGGSVALPRDGAKQGNGSGSQNNKLWSTSTNDAGSASARSASPSSPSRQDYGATSQGPSSASATATTERTALLHDAAAAAPVAKCEKHNGVRGVCCRDLRKAEERHLINPDVVRDVIIGLSDGLTVPFALTAGLSGVGSSRIVVLAGLAELVSGAISMGVGGLLSAQAELSHYNYMCGQTARRVQQSCQGEMEREVCEILEPFGVPADVAALVAAKLQDVERSEEASTGGADELPAPATASVPAPMPRRSDGLVGPQRGLTPFLVRIGKGLEKVEESRVWQSAVVIGASYFIGGFIPLLPYILLASVQTALLVSIVVTGVVLLVFGVVKQSCTGAANDVRGLVWGAVSTLLVGAAAAGSSFAIVRALEA